MRITLVLPAPIRIPMGGAAVAYRHAAGLAERGHEVTVLAPRRTAPGLRGVVTEWAVGLRDRLHGVADVDYYSSPYVRSLTVPRIRAQHMPEADLIIATGVQTARPIAALPASAGRKVYFIQGDETFADPDARATWHLPMARITCAEWLARAVRDAGEEVVDVIPNAIDPEQFGLDRPLEDRPPRVVALYHRHRVKGPDVLLAALRRIRAQRPDVEQVLFSARPPSHSIQYGIEVAVRPTVAELRALYNRSSVLLHPSRSEGWPLVPMEAAACGCAVIASDNSGIHEYLDPDVSMHTAPVGEGDALGDAALAVLDDDGLRLRLAHAARAAVGRLSWRASTDRLDAALRQIAAG